MLRRLLTYILLFGPFVAAMWIGHLGSEIAAASPDHLSAAAGQIYPQTWHGRVFFVRQAERNLVNGLYFAGALAVQALIWLIFAISSRLRRLQHSL